MERVLLLDSCMSRNGLMGWTSLRSVVAVHCVSYGAMDLKTCIIIYDICMPQTPVLIYPGFLERPKQLIQLTDIGTTIFQSRETLILILRCVIPKAHLI